MTAGDQQVSAASTSNDRMCWMGAAAYEWAISAVTLQCFAVPALISSYLVLNGQVQMDSLFQAAPALGPI